MVDWQAALDGILRKLEEGKAIADHPQTSTARHQLSALARRFITLSPYGDHPSFRQDADTQFQGIKGRFRVALRGLYRQWEDDHDTRALLKASEGIFRKFWTQAYKVGLSVGDLSRHMQPHRIRIYKPTLYTSHDEQWVNSAVEQELGFWKRFITQARKDDLRHDPYDRIDWYVKSLESPYHAGRVIALPHLTIIYWDVNVMAEHCMGCRLIAMRGPYTKASLPCTPRDGSTQCLFNCKCTLRYVDTDDVAEYERLSKKSKSAILSIAQSLK